MPRHRTAGAAPLAALLTALLAALLLAGCSLDQGPAGRVTDKDLRGSAMGGSFLYYLTVRTEEGENATFRVSELDYDRCYKGSAYPACTKRTDRARQRPAHLLPRFSPPPGASPADGPGGPAGSA